MTRHAHHSPRGGAERETGTRARVTVLPGAGEIRAMPDESGRGAPFWSRRRVLLLNATFEPLTAVTIRRAIVLVLRDRADVVHADAAGNSVHSAGMAMPVPTVIRLRTYVRVPYRASVPLTRAALMHRDQFRCGYCGTKATTIDHIMPRSRGGGHSWENCVACCANSNHRKADKLLSELGWTLRVAPAAPKGRHWRLLATVKVIDPDWVQYIDAGAA